MFIEIESRARHEEIKALILSYPEVRLSRLFSDRRNVMTEGSSNYRSSMHASRARAEARIATFPEPFSFHPRRNKGRSRRPSDSSHSRETLLRFIWSAPLPMLHLRSHRACVTRNDQRGFEQSSSESRISSCFPRDSSNRAPSSLIDPDSGSITARFLT